MTSKQQRESFQAVCDAESLRNKINTLIRKAIEQGTLTHAEKEFLSQHEEPTHHPSQCLSCFI
jgi:phage I-like protein